jgi:hypothetical protein
MKANSKLELLIKIALMDFSMVLEREPAKDDATNEAGSDIVDGKNDSEGTSGGPALCPEISYSAGADQDCRTAIDMPPEIEDEDQVVVHRHTQLPPGTDTVRNSKEDMPEQSGAKPKSLIPNEHEVQGDVQQKVRNLCIWNTDEAN